MNDSLYNKMVNDIKNLQQDCVIDEERYNNMQEQNKKYNDIISGFKNNFKTLGISYGGLVEIAEIYENNKYPDCENFIVFLNCLIDFHNYTEGLIIDNGGKELVDLEDMLDKENIIEKLTHDELLHNNYYSQAQNTIYTQQQEIENILDGKNISSKTIDLDIFKNKITIIDIKQKNIGLKLDLLNLRKDIMKYLLSKNKIKKQRSTLLDEVNQIKVNTNKTFTEIDSILEDINKNYKLVGCKQYGCKTQCYNDISYCLEHYPDICSECNKVLEKNKHLVNNKKYGIENCCHSCSYNHYFDYFVKNYDINKVLYTFDENDKLYKTKKAVSRINFLDMKKDTEILNSIENREDLLDKSILELCGYTFTDQIPYNKFTKYKMYNRLTRSSILLETFDKKIEYIKLKPSFYAYMGKQEFIAFKNFLEQLLNENHDFDENYYFSDDEQIPAPEHVEEEYESDEVEDFSKVLLKNGVDITRFIF